MPKFGIGFTRFLMFSLTFFIALVQPILGVTIPLVLGALEWGHRGGVRGEQRVKFLYLLAGGLTGIGIHLAIIYWLL